MEVESGRGDSFFAGGQVMEEHSGIGLVGAFVLREADVAVDTKHRAAHRSRVSKIVAADLAKMRRKIANEANHRVAHLGFETRLVGLEPFAAIVRGELAEELKET